MHRITKLKHHIKKKYHGNKFVFVTLVLVLVGALIFASRSRINTNLPGITFERDVTLHLMFAGDILFDRHIDELSQASPLKYAYPFQGLNTLNRSSYDTWIGNLECPVTIEQSTPFQKSNWLRFSCKKEYLPELKKYFDIVSLANNHTDNINGRTGLNETRTHLTEAGIKYFGDFDNKEKNNLCEIIYTKDMPIAYCGYHGVFNLPTDDQLKIINDYSKYFVTFVMPHQGVEYEPTSGTYQKLIYRKMIDNGADAVIGAHPHVIQEAEEYKGKLIFYSLGNFIFDQGDPKTRRHMVIATDVGYSAYKDEYKSLDCRAISNTECLKKAKELQITKPAFTLKFKPIFTASGMDFVTKAQNLSTQEYEPKLRSIGFDKVASSSKIQ